MEKELLIKHLNQIIDHCYWRAEQADSGTSAHDAFSEAAEEVSDLLKRVKEAAPIGWASENSMLDGM
jgi:hypothetical protein